MTRIKVGDTVIFDPHSKTEFLEGKATSSSDHSGCDRIMVLVDDDELWWVSTERIISVNGARV